MVQEKLCILQYNAGSKCITVLCAALYCTVYNSRVLKSGFWYDCFSQHCPWLHPPQWGPWLLEDQLLLEGPYLPSPPGLLLLPKVAKEQSERLRGLRRRGREA